MSNSDVFKTKEGNSELITKRQLTKITERESTTEFADSNTKKKKTTLPNLSPSTRVRTQICNTK